jgi:hypothetical protein
MEISEPGGKPCSRPGSIHDVPGCGPGCFAESIGRRSWTRCGHGTQRGIPCAGAMSAWRTVPWPSRPRVSSAVGTGRWWLPVSLKKRSRPCPNGSGTSSVSLQASGVGIGKASRCAPPTCDETITRWSVRRIATSGFGPTPWRPRAWGPRGATRGDVGNRRRGVGGRARCGRASRPPRSGLVGHHSQCGSGGSESPPTRLASPRGLMPSSLVFAWLQQEQQWGLNSA